MPHYLCSTTYTSTSRALTRSSQTSCPVFVIFQNHHRVLNVSKTKDMIDLYLYLYHIQIVEAYKYLGTTLDNKLTFPSNTDMVAPLCLLSLLSAGINLSRSNTKVYTIWWLMSVAK